MKAFAFLRIVNQSGLLVNLNTMLLLKFQRWVGNNVKCGGAYACQILCGVNIRDDQSGRTGTEPRWMTCMFEIDKPFC